MNNNKYSAYRKVERTIYSCLTMAQLDVAGSMVYRFDKMYNDYNDWIELNYHYNRRCKYIRRNNATS